MAFLGLCLLFAGIALIKSIAAISKQDVPHTVHFSRLARIGVSSPAYNMAGGSL